MTQQVMQIDGNREGEVFQVIYTGFHFNAAPHNFAPSHAILAETTVELGTLFF